MSRLYIDSPLGRIAIGGTDAHISYVSFTDKDEEAAGEVPALLHECAAQLEAYFRKDLRAFDLPLQQEGSPFQQLVWSNLLTIPYGETITYLALAKRLGNVKSIRAAGTANGRNNIAIIVPCHRVIGSGGALTGYAGGIWRKQHLLDLEKGGLLFDLVSAYISHLIWLTNVIRHGLSWLIPSSDLVKIPKTASVFSPEIAGILTCHFSNLTRHYMNAIFREDLSRFDELLQQAADYAGDFLRRINDLPVSMEVPAPQAAALPEKGMGGSAALELFDNRFGAYLTSSAGPVTSDSLRAALPLRLWRATGSPAPLT